MKKKLAVALIAAMTVSSMSSYVAFAEEADTMTMEEVVKAVQESEVPSDLKLG